LQNLSSSTWLTEAALYARANGAVPLKDLFDAPSLFPFRIKQIHAEALVAASSRLDVLRHGLNDDLIMLKARGDAGHPFDTHVAE
jgi:hypothetical protein